MSSKVKICIIGAVFVTMAAALTVCMVLLLKKPKDEPIQRTEAAPNYNVLDRGIVTEDNADNIMDEISDKTAEGMFECKMTTSWTFADGKSSSPNAYVANVENNLYTLYFDVYDEVSNELLYQSPLIPVGKELTNFKLDKELAAGEYNAVVMYKMVDDNNEEVSSVGFKVNILVLN